MTQYDLLKFKLRIKMRKEDDLSECGVAVGARRTGLQGLQRMCEKEEDHMCPYIHYVALSFKYWKCKQQ